MRYSIRRGQEGFLLIIVSIIVFVLAALGLGLLELCRMEGVLVAHDVQYLNAFHLAEAGIDRTLWKLIEDPGWSAGWQDQALNDGAYSVGMAALVEPRWYRVSSTGTSGVISKTITLDVKLCPWPYAYDYGLFWANPSGSATPVRLRNNAVVNGSIFGYGNFSVDAGSSVENYVYATGTVEGNGDYVVGEMPDDLPEPAVFDTSSYDALIAQAALEEAGDWGLGGSYSLFGQTLLVNGNIDLSGAALHGPGTIVATGSITIGNSSEITDGVDIICGSDLLFDNLSIYEGSGNVIFATSSIEITNHATLGERLFILTLGRLTLDNYATVHGLLHADERST